MRSYELHAQAQQVQRSTGRSSVAAAAYRSASVIYDDRTGLTHDYRRKADNVEFTRVYVSDNAPDWASDRATLWNAVELKENRKNSTTAHELIVAYPSEFNALQRREHGDVMAGEILRRYKGAVDISYHKPSQSIDENGEIISNENHHSHMMFTTRGFDASTKDGWEKTKFRDLSRDRYLDKKGHPYRDTDGKIITRGHLEIHDLRHFVAAEMNRIAQRDGLNVRTEYESFEVRGIEREPTQKQGYVATQMERKGKTSERGNVNREIRAANESVYDLEKQKKIIHLDYNHQKRALDRQAETQKKTLKQIENNLKSRNRFLGFITGKTKEDQRKAADIREHLHEKIIKDKREKRTAQQLRTEDREEFQKKRHIERANDNRMNQQQREARRLAQLKQDPLEPSRDLGTGMANVAGREFEKAVLEDNKTGRQQEQTRARLSDQHAKPVIDSRSEEAVNNNRFGGLLTPEQIAENVKMQRELHGAPVERGDYRDGLKPEFRERLERAEQKQNAEPVDIESPAEKRSQGHKPDLE